MYYLDANKFNNNLQSHAELKEERHNKGKHSFLPLEVHGVLSRNEKQCILFANATMRLPYFIFRNLYNGSLTWHSPNKILSLDPDQVFCIIIILHFIVTVSLSATRDSD
jgi:hypothetical protein